MSWLLEVVLLHSKSAAARATFNSSSFSSVLPSSVSDTSNEALKRIPLLV